MQNRQIWLKNRKKLAFAECSEKYRERLVNNITPAERRFKAILGALGIHYKFQYVVLVDDGFYILDFFIPHCRVGFEIDGGYHFTEERIRLDLERTKKIQQRGIKIIRFTNSDVLIDYGTTLRKVRVNIPYQPPIKFAPKPSECAKPNNKRKSMHPYVTPPSGAFLMDQAYKATLK